MTDERVPLVSSAQCCRALSRAGFAPRGPARGSHQTWRKVSADRTYFVVVVMGLREIPRGTLRDIITKSGLTVAEFRAFLR